MLELYIVSNKVCHFEAGADIASHLLYYVTHSQGCDSVVPHLYYVTHSQGCDSVVPHFHDLNEGYLVLSIDDDPINQMVVENLLSTEGYEIEQALGKTLQRRRCCRSFSCLHHHAWLICRW